MAEHLRNTGLRFDASGWVPSDTAVQMMKDVVRDFKLDNDWFLQRKLEMSLIGYRDVTDVQDCPEVESLAK